jgi:hypothetical protein
MTTGHLGRGHARFLHIHQQLKKPAMANDLPAVKPAAERGNSRPGDLVGLDDLLGPFLSQIAAIGGSIYRSVCCGW